MDRVRVFLRTCLFSPPVDAENGSSERHVPKNTIAVEGTIREQARGGVVIDATRYFVDARSGIAPASDGTAHSLFLPMSKIDHMLLLEDE